MNAKTLGALTHTHTQGNLINKLKHKNMVYLCDFKLCKII